MPMSSYNFSVKAVILEKEKLKVAAIASREAMQMYLELKLLI